MGQLLQFIYRLRVFLLFILLEVVAAWLIVRNNSYQSYAFFSSSNRLVGGIYQSTTSFTSYFTAGAELRELREQNARLLAELRSFELMPNDSSHQADASQDLRFQVVPAKVINNSIWQNDNYITLNRGRKHGIQRGMGVISAQGVVGQIKGVSENFSTAFSVLHGNIRISSQLKKDKILCTTQWNTETSTNNFRQASILYLPFHVRVQVGDTVETSGYNAVFPEGIVIGTINRVNKDTTQNFLDVTVELATDFSKLKNVFVVGDTLRHEQAALELM